MHGSMPHLVNLQVFFFVTMFGTKNIKMLIGTNIRKEPTSFGQYIKDCRFHFLELSDFGQIIRQSGSQFPYLQQNWVGLMDPRGPIIMISLFLSMGIRPFLHDLALADLSRLIFHFSLKSSLNQSYQ